MDALPVLPYTLAVIPPFLAAVANEKKFPTKQVVGSVLLGVALTGMGTWNAKLTNQLTWLIALTSMLMYGTPFLKMISKAVS